MKCIAFAISTNRDLIGFVDGTENPTAQAAIDAVYIGAEDQAFAGGSYVLVQKYVHDMDGWNALSTEAQERIIGRSKPSDIELEDAIKPTSAHNALTTITENGKEVKMLRDNMPFGNAAAREFGTYFIGYARSARTLEQMLKNMFISRPGGNYDHLLDFSLPKTGNLFFVPSATFLENVADDAASVVRTAPPGGTSERAFTAESIDLIERLDRKMHGIAHEGCGRLCLTPQAISP